MADAAGEFMVPDSGTAVLEWRAGLTCEPAFLGASALLFTASAGVTIY